MIRYIITTLVLMIISFNLSAQDISPTVLGSSGGFFENQGYSMSLTVGESIIQTHQNSNAAILQGFQQAEYRINVTVGELDPEFTIAVFPNPASDNLSVTVENNLEALVIEMYDLLGRRIMRQDFSGSFLRVSLSNFANSNYMVVIKRENGIPIGSWKIVKQD